MIGPIINGAAVIGGSIMGALFGKKIPENIKTRLPMVFGCSSLGLGVTMIVKGENLPVVILSLLAGTILGELMHWERGILFLAAKARAVIERVFHPHETDLTHEEYMERFVALIVLFCASGTGIFGAMNEGMLGDPTLLIVKSLLDLPTAAIFASTLGLTLAAVALPQFIIQMILFLGASYILPLTTPAMIADFSAVGGLLMLATGFKILGLVPFPTASMLPALFLSMPLTAVWTKFFM